MEKWWFNSMLFNRELEYRRGLSKSMDSFGPIENTSVSEDPILTDMDKNIHSWSDSDNSSYSNVDYLVGVRNIRNFLSDKTFLVRDRNGNSYSIYLDIKKKIFEIDNDHSFLSEPESFFYSYKNSNYLNNVSNSDDPHYDHSMYDTKSSWNNNINSYIDSYLRSQICIDSYILGDSDKYNDSYFYSYICGKGRNSSESESSSIITSTNDTNDSDLTRRESSNDLDETKKYKHLWIECENCYGLNYKKFFKSKMNICEHCGYHLKMSPP